MPFLPDADLLLLTAVLTACGLVPALLALRAGASPAEPVVAEPAAAELATAELAAANWAAGAVAALAPFGAEAARDAARRAGCPVVTGLALERGEWRIEAEDAAGRARLLHLDAWTGRLRAAQPAPSASATR